jgi:hypothetical protein
MKVELTPVFAGRLGVLLEVKKWEEKNPKKRYARHSFVAAKCGKKILAPMTYKGTCNAQLFEKWIEKILLPELKKGQIIIMDNATFHKSERTKILIESAGCHLLFLPPYSPDFNPIEMFWARFKT